MELKTYWEIVLRRAWVVVVTVVLALVASAAGLVLIPQAISYQATVRLAVRPLPEARTGDYYTYDEYYAYLASEYLNDDVIELIQGATFLQGLQARLKDRFASPPSGSIKAKKAHRVLAITVTSGTAAEALALAQETTRVLIESSQQYFGQLTAKEPMVSVIDQPAITAGPGTRAQLDLALRGVLGLLAGVALAFLLDYLDDTVRSAEEIERLLGVPALGEIPPERPVRRKVGAAAGLRIWRRA